MQQPYMMGAKAAAGHDWFFGARPGRRLWLCRVPHGGAVQVDPWLESAWFQPLSLHSETSFKVLLSTCNLYRYSEKRQIARTYLEKNAKERSGGAVQVEVSLPIA
jgi:hypothetical protein